MFKLGIKTKFDYKQISMIRKKNIFLVANGPLVRGQYTLDHGRNIVLTFTALLASLRVCHHRLSHLIFS